MLWNAATRQFVMWVHVDDASYETAKVGRRDVAARDRALHLHGQLPAAWAAVARPHALSGAPCSGGGSRVNQQFTHSVPHAVHGPLPAKGYCSDLRLFWDGKPLAWATMHRLLACFTACCVHQDVRRAVATMIYGMLCPPGR